MKTVRAGIALYGIAFALLLPITAKSQPLYNIVYGQNTDWKGNLVQLKMDIYFPEDIIPGKKYPLVMQMHSGSFFEGTKEKLADKCEILTDSGFIAATINYRLGWDYALKCQGDTASLARAVYRALQDANAALRFLVYKADAYNIDTSWIFIGGASAGAIMALEMSYLNDEMAMAVMPEIVAELGGLNNSTNYLTNTFTVRGISSIAGALSDSSMIHAGKTYPTIFFQGDSDEVIPVDTGTYMWCPTYNKMFGSLCLYRRLVANNESAIAHILHGSKHENSETSGYNDEFTMGNTACFFHKLMNGKKPPGKIYYNYESSCMEDGIKGFYRDKDADGFGNSNDYILDSIQPAGYVTISGDCNDNNAAVHPGATEVCDGFDNNCNGIIDEKTFTASIAETGIVPLCSGEYDVLTANKLANTTYQWLKNGNVINAANNAVLVVTTEGNYSVAETLNGMCKDTSAITIVATAPKPTAKIYVLGSPNICSKATDTLVATGGTGFKYQWSRNNVKIPGATARVYVARYAGNYTVAVTNKYSCTSISKTTAVTANCFDYLANAESDETAGFKQTCAVYPNPAKDKVIIHFTAAKTQNVEILIFSITGRKVYAAKKTAAKGANDYVLPIAGLGQGVYYVELKNEAGSLKTKLFIEK